MPKSVGEEIIKSKRATTKRLSSTTEKNAPVKRVRKSAVKKAVPKKSADGPNETTEDDIRLEAVEVSNNSRKAPTTFSAQKTAQKRFRINVIVVGIILLFGVGSSAVVGFTDEGQINVNEVIEARNERVRNNQTDGRDVVANTVNVPVQNTNNSNQVDGGLVGLGDSTITVPTDISSTASTTPASEVASTSEAVASSTEAEVSDTDPEQNLESEVTTE
jgi:hypothetical protein